MATIFRAPLSAPIADPRRRFAEPCPTPNLLLTTLQGKDALPFRQQDWPLTFRKPPLVSTSHLRSTVDPATVAVSAVPFAQEDWPTVRERTKSADLSRWLHAVNLNILGKDTFFGAPGEPPTSMWPLAPPARPREALTFINPVNLNLLSKDQFFGAPGETKTYDYPVPASRPLAARTFLHPLNLLLLLPFAQTDWPTPPARKGPALTFLNPVNLLLIGQDALPFRQQDWPRTFQKPPLVSTVHFRVSTDPPAAILPYSQYDWPTPTGRRGPALTWLNPLNLLAGQDQLPFRQQDWPLTFLKPPLVKTAHYRTNVDPATAPVVTLPFANYDWPLAAKRPSAISILHFRVAGEVPASEVVGGGTQMIVHYRPYPAHLRTWYAPNLVLLVTPPVQPPQGIATELARVIPRPYDVLTFAPPNFLLLITPPPELPPYGNTGELARGPLYPVDLRTLLNPINPNLFPPEVVISDILAQITGGHWPPMPELHRKKLEHLARQPSTRESLLKALRQMQERDDEEEILLMIRFDE